MEHSSRLLAQADCEKSGLAMSQCCLLTLHVLCTKHPCTWAVLCHVDCKGASIRGSGNASVVVPVARANSADAAAEGVFDCWHGEQVGVNTVLHSMHVMAVSLLHSQSLLQAAAAQSCITMHW